jgi:hypothetical protein
MKFRLSPFREKGTHKAEADVSWVRLSPPWERIEVRVLPMSPV